MKNFFALLTVLVSVTALGKETFTSVPNVVCSGGSFGKYATVALTQGTSLKDESGSDFDGSFYSGATNGIEIVANVTLSEYSPTTYVTIRTRGKSGSPDVEATGRGWAQLKAGATQVTCQGFFGG